MQDHQFSFDVDASPEEIWAVFWQRRPVTEHGSVKIVLRNPGDEIGNGLVRETRFRVPRWLGTGGVGRSWEWITEVVPNVSWRYDAIGAPPWSRATGWTRLEPIDAHRTRVHFRETYEVLSWWMRPFERAVHDAISADNDTMIRTAVEQGVVYQRRKRAT
ncbi:MAG: SRPBCC family protein [Acidimicrobiia bacterium]